MPCKKLFVNIAFMTLCLYNVQSLEIKDCGSYFTYANLKFDGCDIDNDLTCPIYIGSLMTISFQINTGKDDGPFDINGDLVNDVAFYVRGGPRFNLTVTPSNACEILACPLDIDYSATLTAEIYIDEKYQPLSGVDLRWILQTADLLEQLLCFQFPITVQYP